ncbi:hypothetical protein D3C87_2026420 [compost metagenome]
MTACICKEVGYNIDPFSDFARELVAYTFEVLEADVVDDLMLEAVDNVIRNTTQHTREATVPGGP